jgi:hypothetical protein
MGELLPWARASPRQECLGKFTGGWPISLRCEGPIQSRFVDRVGLGCGRGLSECLLVSRLDSQFTFLKIDSNHSLLSLGVRPKTAPTPTAPAAPPVRASTDSDELAQFLHSLPLAPHVEIVKAFLLDVLVINVGPEIHLSQHCVSSSLFGRTSASPFS